MMPMLLSNFHSSRPWGVKIVPTVSIAVGLFLAGAVTPATVLAQKKKPAGGGHAAGGGGGHAASSGGAGGHGAGMPGARGMGPGIMSPGMNMPGMNMPGMNMPGMGMAGQKKKAKTQPKRDRAASEELDNESLPEGYHVPPVPPDALTTTDEWIEEPFEAADAKAQATKQRMMIGAYKRVLSNGDFANNEEKELVRKIVIWKLSMLTRKDNRDNVEKERRKIEQDIKSTPGNKSGPRAVRKFLLDAIVKETPELFKYHFIARLNGAILLAELSGPEFNLEEASGRTPAKPCLLAFDPLIALVSDRSQLAAVRIWGVNGLVRLATMPELNAQKRNDIVDLLVKELNESGNEHEWYQWRLAEGLGKLNVIQNQAKVPVVPQALAMVLADSNRPWLVRAEAAQSLGRLPYDRDIDLGLVAYETGRLAKQMTDAFNKEPKRSSWKICFIKLYGAFKPVDEEDEKRKLGLLKQVEQKPALSSYKRTVQEAFELVLPLVAKVVNNPAGIDVPLGNLQKWLDANPPKNATLQPGLEPIVKQDNQDGRAPAGAPVAGS